MGQTPDSLALVVLSTDSFSDIWPVFFSNFKKNWPRFSGKKYLITDAVTCYEKDVITLHPALNEYKGKMDWGGRFLSCLPEIKENDLLIFLEDFILIKPINDAEFEKAYNFFLDKEIHFLTLGSHDLNRYGYFDLKNDFCRVKRFTKYRMTTSPGLTPARDNNCV